MRSHTALIPHRPAARFQAVGAATCLLIALAFAPAAAEEVTVQLTPEEQARAGIIVRPVLERAFGDALRIVGQVVSTPGSTLDVKSILAGRVEELFVSPGDAVEAGDVLLTIHSHDLLGMQGELMKAHRQMRMAESREEAGRQLYEIQGISRVELEQRQQSALTARLAYEQVRAELRDLGYTDEELDEMLSSQAPSAHCPIRASMSGVVMNLDVHQHEWIEAYDQLLVLGNPRRIEVHLQVPPDESGGISAGDLVQFAPVGRPESTGIGRIIGSVPQVDPSTRTVTVRASITEGSAELYPGVFVQGQVVQGGTRNAPSVPEKAVTRFGGSDYVFVRTGTDTFAARAVELGRFNGTRYEILKGAAPGEEVVVEGVFFLKSTLLKGSGEEE